MGRPSPLFTFRAGHTETKKMDMEAASLHVLPDPSHTHLESIKVLVTTYKDEKEMCKKILHVNSAKDIIDQSLAQQTGCVLHRSLKYNTDFKEYVDIDPKEELKDFDRFHIFLSARGTQAENCHMETNQNQEHFYDLVSHCGFIELKLRNLRRALHDDQRRYRKRGRSSDPSAVGIILEVIAEGEEESIKEWITATKRLRPSPENLASIKMGMEKTFTSRRFWITSKSPTVAEIFQQYPRFVDLPCLLDAEFGKMFPGKEDLFLRKWEGHIVPKLVKVATLENDLNVLSAGEESDESLCFRALQLLTLYLPPTASGRTKGWTKCSVKSALSYILDVKPTGTSIPSLLEGSFEAAVGVHQPKLACLGDPSTTAQYIIMARNDKVTIPLQDEGLTCAIDKLFKMLWVCNVAYPVQLESVYCFFEHVYDMPISGGKRSEVVELIAKLQAVA